MKPSIICLATSRKQAGQIVDCLKTTGFEPRDVSVVLPTIDCDLVAATDPQGEDAVLLGAVSGQARGALGWIPGFHAFAIPGTGSFIAAGPILAILDQPASNANIGAMAGALMGCGVPAAAARSYEEKIEGGDILVAARTDDEHQLEQAQEIFRAVGAFDISHVGEAFRARNSYQPGSRPHLFATISKP